MVTFAVVLFGLLVLIVVFSVYSGLIPSLSSYSNDTEDPTTTLTSLEDNSNMPTEKAPDPTPSTVRSPTQFQRSTPTPIQTPTPQLTPVPTPQPTVSPTATPAPTLTPTPKSEFSNKKYDEFVGAVFGEAEVDTGVPIRIRAWSVAEGNSLIVILNLTSESKNDARRAKEVNTLVTSGYVQAVAHHDLERIDGKITDRLRIAEVNNTGAKPKTLIVNTSLAREYYTGQIDAAEFTEEYWNTERNMTADEIEFVYNMDMRTGNQTLYNGTGD